ncbi:unnamed protein product [Phytomonas sp. EM1]|nr:unnamed protein product [Phytomonas sp. EM1]|eukprot:CCW65112.1 unnamed protein product [Phytomonas sp. isolate EM1]
MQHRLDITPSTLPRTELLQWINTSLPCSTPNKGTVTPIKKVEQCGSGVPYVLLLPTMLPILYTPLITKAKVPAHHEFEAVINLKLIQEALHRNGIPKPDILTEDLSKIINGNFQANLHLLQWFHGLYTALKENGIEACQRRISSSDVRPIDTLARSKPNGPVFENGRRTQWLREGEQHHVEVNSYVQHHEGAEAHKNTSNLSRESSSTPCSQGNFNSPQAQPKMKSRKPNRHEPSVASSDKGRSRPFSAPTTITKHPTTPSKATQATQKQKPTTPKGSLIRSAGTRRISTPISRSQSVGTSINKITGHARSPMLLSSGLVSRHAPAINFSTGADSNSTAFGSGDGTRCEQTHAPWSSGLNISNMANGGTHSRGRSRRTPKLLVTKVGTLSDAPQEQLSIEEESQDAVSRSAKSVTTRQKGSEPNNGLCNQSDFVPPTDNSEVSFHDNSKLTSEALTQQLQEVTVDKHFYYDKLRMIECLVLKELNSKTTGAAVLANSIKDILYAQK